MTTFHDFALPAEILKSLEDMNFTTPTPIQEQAIPLALEGRDIVGSAHTGTGKTAAFVLPMLTKLLNDKKATALVLTPTRELAQQVNDFIRKILGRTIPLKTALLIGGEPMPKQFRQLDMNPRLIIGTPGRVNDHLNRRSLSLQSTSMLVLDEMDRMLDFGFGVQLDEIARYLPAEKQTLMFSATLPAEIKRILGKYVNDPAHIAVDSVAKPALNITHESLFIQEADKYSTLLTQLDQRSGSIIIFVKTKRSAEKLSKSLEEEGHGVDYLHGDLKQSRRTKTIGAFYKKKYRILIATDVAARGLDIPHIEHVINYNLPQCPEDYIHRIGRTARAGASGAAVCFISNGERNLWRAIQPMIDPDAKPLPQERASRSAGPRSGRSQDRGMRRSSDRFDQPRQRQDRSERSERPAFARSSDRFDQPRQRQDRSERSERPAFARSSDRFDQPRQRQDRSERSERPAFARSSDRFTSERPARQDSARPSERSRDRFAKADKPFASSARKDSDRPFGRSAERGNQKPSSRSSGPKDRGFAKPSDRSAGKSFAGKSSPNRKEFAPSKARSQRQPRLTLSS
jgi:Superfamily II DNA and RNA helicases